MYFNRGQQTEASLRTNVHKRKSLFAGLHYHCTVGYNCHFSEDVSFIFLGQLPKDSTGVLYSNPETKKTLCIMFPVNHWNRADTAGKGGILGWFGGLFTDNYSLFSHFIYENYILEFIFIIFTQGGTSFLITVSWFFETSNHSQIYGRLLRSSLPHGGSTAVFKQSNLFSAHSCSFSSSLYLSNLIRSLSSPRAPLCFTSFIFCPTQINSSWHTFPVPADAVRLSKKHTKLCSPQCKVLHI